MAQDTRVGDRQPTSMRIKLKYPDVETFIQKYAVNISRGGIFIATKTPKPVGTPLKFEFVLASGETGLSIIRGEGQVLWTREFDPAQPTKAHGMGVKFTRLDAESQAIVDRALAFRAQQSERRAESAQEPSEGGEGSGSMASAGLSTAPTPAPIEVAPPASAPVVASAPPPLIPPGAAGASLMGRAPDEVTRPLPIGAARPAPPPADEPAPGLIGRAREDVTRPISVEEEERTKETVLPPAGRPLGAQPRVKLALERNPSREIRIRGASRDGALAELEAIASEWGVSEEQIERVLKRRRPRMVEATAELERLLRKPQRPPTPTRQEAMAGLRELLSRRAPVLEIDARAPNGDAGQPPIKKAR